MVRQWPRAAYEGNVSCIVNAQTSTLLIFAATYQLGCANSLGISGTASSWPKRDWSAWGFRQCEPKSVSKEDNSSLTFFLAKFSYQRVVRESLHSKFALM